MPLKQQVGIVISNKMQKTIVVKIENRYPHPIYSKTLYFIIKINPLLRQCVFSYYLVLECLTNRSNYSKSIATYFEYQFLTTVSKPLS